MAKFDIQQFNRLITNMKYDEALKYLKHNLSKDSYNYYKCYDDLYRIMCGNTLDYGKEYKKHHELYLEYLYCDKTIKKEDSFWLYYGSYLINQSISSSKKIKNGKKLYEGIKYIDEFIQTTKSLDRYLLSEKVKELLFDVFSNESYELHKLYIAYIINPVAHHDLIDEFTLLDINILLSLNDNTVNYELRKYLEVLKKYKYGKCDDEIRMKMADYYCKTNKFCDQNINAALSLLMEAYNNGYPGSFEKIIELFDNDKLVRSHKLNFVKNHMKKYPEDNKIALIYADELYFLFHQKKKSDLKLLTKALEIYLENELILNDEQMDRLSYAYLNGCGLEKNRALALKYAKSKKARNLLFLEDVDKFKNLNFLSDIYKDEVYDLINGYYDDDAKKLFKLLNVLYQHTIVEKNDNLFYLVSCKLYDISPKSYGAVAMAYLYLEGINVEKSIDEFNKYLLIGLKENFSEAYMLKAYYLLKNDSSLNDVKSVLDKAVSLGSSNAEVVFAVKFGEKYPSESFDYLIHAYNSKNNYAIKLLGQFYEKGIGTNVDYDKAIKYYSEYAYKVYDSSYYYQIYKLYQKIGNEEKSFEYLRKAADNKVVEALKDIIGILNDKNRSTAEEKLLEKYKNFGEEISIPSFLYSKGNELAKTNKEDAIEYYIKSAESGYTLGYIAAATIYFTLGQYENSKTYYIKALDNHNQESVLGILKCDIALGNDLTQIYQLAFQSDDLKIKDIVSAYIFFYGTTTIQSDITKALTLACIYEDSNDLVEALLICKLMAKIYHIKKDYEKAFKYFKKSFEINEDDKEVNEWLGYYYSLDSFKKASDKLSIKHYLKAAEQKSDVALYNLSLHYKKTQEYPKALDYANKGLSYGYDYFLLLITNILIDINDYEQLEKIINNNKNNKFISYPLGYMYYHGFRVKDDKIKAYKKLTEAYNLITSENINDIAGSYLYIITYYLGLCYYHGYGVDISHSIAAQYFKETFNYSSNTDKKAKKYIEQILNNIAG